MRSPKQPDPKRSKGHTLIIIKIYIFVTLFGMENSHTQLFLVSPKYSKRLEYVIHLWNTQLASPTLVYSSDIPENFPYLLYTEDSRIPNSGFLLSENRDFSLHQVDFSLDFPDFDFFSYAFVLATECFYYSHHFPKDKYQRYLESENPVLVHGLHEKPFFAFWAKKIGNYLNIPIQFYPPEPLWVTLDIDNPFHFQHRGFFSQIKSLLKDIALGNGQEFIFKLKILLGFVDDPFKVKNWLPYIKNQQYLVFFLMNDQDNNSNTSPQNVFYHQEILKVPIENMGIHFSLKSSRNIFQIMQTEKRVLESVIQGVIYKSRQHFLQYELPQTFQNLLQVGIQQDYTTCFYSRKGYKHGLVRPFLWYDLSKEEITRLIRFPVFFMDRHALNEKMSSQETAVYIQEQTKLIQSFGGIPMILLHNETFSQRREWKNYSAKDWWEEYN